MRTCERALIGGSCPNIASLPSRNLIHSGKVVDFVRHVGEFGLRLGPWSVHMAGVQQHRRAMVDAMIVIYKTRFAVDGLELTIGAGCFVDRCTWRRRKTPPRNGTHLFRIPARATIPDIPGPPTSVHLPVSERSRSSGWQPIGSCSATRSAYLSSPGAFKAELCHSEPLAAPEITA